MTKTVKTAAVQADGSVYTMKQTRSKHETNLEHT